ncbi:MAG: recombinase family protein [Acidobacteria bacterium]|nr:recombinase family protein [Acidobacteriota bacterium]
MAKQRAKAPTRAWGYTRVSTGAQAEHGVSLAAQRKSIQGYCELHGLELVKVHEDRGLSGKTTNGRAGLHKAIEGACTAPGGVLVLQITNRHVDLERVVRGLADAAGLQALRLDQVPLEGSGVIRNAWMWLAAEGTPAPDGANVTDPTQAAPVLWTDDFSNLIGVLR